MKTVTEKLETRYHQTIATGSANTPGHSTLAEAAVVLIPQHFTNPDVTDDKKGEVIGEHVGHHEHSSEHVKAHAKAGHLGRHHAHHVHEATHSKGEHPTAGGHEGYRHHEEGHPHKLRGDHMRHNPHEKASHSKSHKTPHK